MAAWLSIYCRRAVSHLTAADLRSGIDNGEMDYYTAAEGFGIEDEEIVDRAMARLRVEPVAGLDDVRFRIHYRLARLRQIDLLLTTDAAKVRALCEEALEQFDGAKAKGPTKARTHLAKVVEVASLELGWSQLEDMAIVFASQMAEHLARIGDGLIRDQNDDWWGMKGVIPVLLVGPERRG